MNIKKFKGYFLNLILIWATILMYKALPYYQDFIRLETVNIIVIIALSYTSGGFIYYIFTNSEKVKETKGELVFRFIKKTIFNLEIYVKSKDKLHRLKIEKKERVALLFVLVKIFFLPIMINFVLANFFSVKSQLPRIISAHSSLFNIETFNLLLYPFILALIFFFDTLWFAFGYASEAGFLKNKIISVEPTIIGWGVALICYPPFNSLVTNYLGWYSNDYILFSNPTITFIMRILIIIFLGIYVSATFALGTKCSNLTNRGIITRGPYSIIRHPAYISKNLAWWMTLIPILSWQAVLGMMCWSLIYHFRSLTEEKHLKKDPDYIEYCKKVRYKYIPGIY